MLAQMLLARPSISPRCIAASIASPPP